MKNEKLNKGTNIEKNSINLNNLFSPDYLENAIHEKIREAE